MSCCIKHFLRLSIRYKPRSVEVIQLVKDIDKVEYSPRVNIYRLVRAVGRVVICIILGISL